MDKTTDENGSVTLDRKYSKIHMGLPYESLVETLDPEISDDKGSLKGKTKRVIEIIFQVSGSAEFEAGTEYSKHVKNEINGGEKLARSATLGNWLF